MTTRKRPVRRTKKRPNPELIAERLSAEVLCPIHKQYKAKYIPLSGCPICWRAYHRLHPEKV